MSTQDFLPQDSTTRDTIRYYTEFDPYYYTVDNRPLQDIESILDDTREGGGDAGRRAAILGALNTSAVFSHLFTTSSSLSGMSGLGIVQVSGNQIRVLPGAIYDTKTVSQSIADAVVKQALLTKNTDFTISPPVNVGTSLVYTIEGQFIELDNNTMTTSQLPYVDATNKYLPSTLMNGELKLFLNAGTAATTGTEVPPTTTAGRYPLYNITIAQGATTFTVTRHSNAPYQKGLATRTRPVGTGAIANNMEYFALPDGAVTTLPLALTLGQDSINPFTPIKVQVTFYPTITGGNAAIRLRYKGFATGELVTASTFATAIQAVPISAVANGLQTLTTTVAVPNTEFAGFVNGRWTINKEYLNIALERVGNDVSDTATGDIRVIGVTLLQ